MYIYNNINPMLLMMFLNLGNLRSFICVLSFTLHLCLFRFCLKATNKQDSFKLRTRKCKRKHTAVAYSGQCGNIS